MINFKSLATGSFLFLFALSSSLKADENSTQRILLLLESVWIQNSAQKIVGKMNETTATIIDLQQKKSESESDGSDQAGEKKKPAKKNPLEKYKEPIEKNEELQRSLFRSFGVFELAPRILAMMFDPAKGLKTFPELESFELELTRIFSDIEKLREEVDALVDGLDLTQENARLDFVKNKTPEISDKLDFIALRLDEKFGKLSSLMGLSFVHYAVDYKMELPKPNKQDLRIEINGYTVFSALAASERDAANAFQQIREKLDLEDFFVRRTSESLGSIEVEFPEISRDDIVIGLNQGRDKFRQLIKSTQEMMDEIMKDDPKLGSKPTKGGPQIKEPQLNLRFDEAIVMTTALLEGLTPDQLKIIADKNKGKIFFQYATLLQKIFQSFNLCNDSICGLGFKLEENSAVRSTTVLEQKLEWRKRAADRRVKFVAADLMSGSYLKSMDAAAKQLTVLNGVLMGLFPELVPAIKWTKYRGQRSDRENMYRFRSKLGPIVSGSDKLCLCEWKITAGRRATNTATS